jgi:hypothetical protein
MQLMSAFFPSKREKAKEKGTTLPHTNNGIISLKEEKTFRDLT